MKRSALVTGHSLVRKSTLAAGLLLIPTFLSPVYANSAANASDSFRISPEDVKSNETALGVSDPSFRSLHGNWGSAVGAPAKTQVSIPSINPVETMAFSSGFGSRKAPTRGASRNHKGIDLRGPVGTPIYATADGIVGRAQWVRGYGKYVELEHGNAIETRYAHMSALNVYPGQRIRKGEILGFMGSTGYSTGSHLHYEVRIGGEAVNPSSFLASVNSFDGQAKQLLAARQVDTTAAGGPEN